MKRLLSVVVALVCVTGIASAEKSDAKAKYVGGTLSCAEKTSGTFNLAGETQAVFQSKNQQTVVVYQRIESIEYGQKAGRRVGAAVIVSPLFLLSKKRKHYVTLAFTDPDGTKQGAVFEVPKDSVYNLVTTLAQRSGREIEYESEEAKKHLERAK